MVIAHLLYKTYEICIEFEHIWYFSLVDLIYFRQLLNPCIVILFYLVEGA